MVTVKMVNILYYLGTDAKKLDKNYWFTLEETLFEAQRVASTLKNPISIFMLLNGITIKICTVLVDTSVVYEADIFNDGNHIINTILAFIDDFASKDSSIVNAMVHTIEQIAEVNEVTSDLLTYDDYKELLGLDFIDEVKRLAGKETSKFFFKIIARIDSLLEEHNFKLSDTLITNVRSLLDSYKYAIDIDPEKAKDTGLIDLVQRAAGYVRLSI